MARTIPDVNNNLQLKADDISIVLSAYEQLHGEVQANQDLEHKITFAVGGLFLVFSALMLRGQFGFYGIWEVYLIWLFVAIISGISTAFLLYNWGEMKWQCRMIVRCEIAMGLYTPNKLLKNISILGDEGLSWGSKGGLNSFPFIVGVWSSALAAALCTYLGYENVNNKPPTPPNPLIAKIDSLLADNHALIEAFQQNSAKLMVSISDATASTNKKLDDLPAAIHSILIAQPPVQSAPPSTQTHTGSPPSPKKPQRTSGRH